MQSTSANQHEDFGVDQQVHAVVRATQERLQNVLGALQANTRISSAAIAGRGKVHSTYHEDSAAEDAKVELCIAGDQRQHRGQHQLDGHVKEFIEVQRRPHGGEQEPDGLVHACRTQQQTDRERAGKQWKWSKQSQLLQTYQGR